MRYIPIALFILVITQCLGQTRDSLATTPKLAARWTPFNLAGKFPAIQLGIEYRLAKSNPHWTLSHDLGIVIKTKNNSESFSDKSGFKANTELRYYAILSKKAPFYISADVYYHQFKYDRTDLIGYDCETGECSYYQYISWRRQYTMRRIAFKFGYVIFLEPANRLFADISVGLGYRIRHSKDYDKPALPANGTSFGPDNTWNESTLVEDEERIAPVANLRVGYKFK